MYSPPPVIYYSINSILFLIFFLINVKLWLVAGNGNYCLSCGQDKSIKLWNPHKGVLIKTYTGHGYEVLDVAVYVLTLLLLLRLLHHLSSLGA